MELKNYVFIIYGLMFIIFIITTMFAFGTELCILAGMVRLFQKQSISKSKLAEVFYVHKDRIPDTTLCPHGMTVSFCHTVFLEMCSFTPALESGLKDAIENYALDFCIHAYCILVRWYCKKDYHSPTEHAELKFLRAILQSKIDFGIDMTVSSKEALAETDMFLQCRSLFY
jgi:hypothetical protein